MMRAPTSRDFRELLEEIEEQPGWRVEDTKNGWRIYPADHSIPVIQARGLRDGGDFRAMDNLRAHLRRAGYPPLLRQPKEAPHMPAKTPATATPATVATLHLQPAPPPVATPATPATRNLIAEARGHISNIMESLSALDGVLTEIVADQESMLKLKLMLQSMLK